MEHEPMDGHGMEPFLEHQLVALAAINTWQRTSENVAGDPPELGHLLLCCCTDEVDLMLQAFASAADVMLERHVVRQALALVREALQSAFAEELEACLVWGFLLGQHGHQGYVDPAPLATAAPASAVDNAHTVMMKGEEAVGFSPASSFFLEREREEEDYHCYGPSPRQGCDSLEHHLPRCQEEVEDLQHQLSFQISQATALQREVNRTKSSLFLERDAHDADSEEISRLLQDLARSSSRLSKAEDETFKLREETRQLQDRVDELQEAETDFKDVIKSKTKRIEVLEQANFVLGEKLTKKELEVDEVKHQLQSERQNHLNRKPNQLNHVVDINCIGQCQEKVDFLQSSIETLKDELRQKQEELEAEELIKQDVADRLRALNVNVELLIDNDEDDEDSMQRAGTAGKAQAQKKASGSKATYTGAKERREAERRKDLGGKAKDKRHSVNVESYEVEPQNKGAARPEMKELQKLEDKVRSATPKKSATSASVHRSNSLNPHFLANSESQKSLDMELRRASNDDRRGGQSRGSTSVITKSNKSLEKNSSGSDRMKSSTNSLSIQEQRTKIAFLENEQAELETEIRRLKSQVHGEDYEDGSLEQLHSMVRQELQQSKVLDEKMTMMRKRNGHEPDLGNDNHDDLDGICRSIVDKVLRKIRSEESANQGATLLTKESSQKCWSEDPVKDPRDQQLIELQQERLRRRELENALRVERQKSLDWSERHNKERDSRHLLQAEMEELRGRMECLQRKAAREKEELDRVASLLESERAQGAMLEEALRMERDNFHQMQQTLDHERHRSKAASDRDTETIIELRTALEMEREQHGMPSKPPLEGFGAVEHATGIETNHMVPFGDDPAKDPFFIIRQLEMELADERHRVDALKNCLEQEREKTEFLLLSAQTNGDPSLQHEWIVFNQRRFEALEIQRSQLLKDIQRLRVLNSRLTEEVDHLRGQLRTSGAVAVSKSFEHFYVKDLESKVDTFRHREFAMAEEVERARLLIQSLQTENAMLVEREKERVEQNQEPLEQIGPGPSSELQEVKMRRILEDNQMLQDKVKLLENRILRLKDDLEEETDTQGLFVKREGGGQDLLERQMKDLKKSMSDLDRHRQSLIWQKQFLLLLLNTHVRSGLTSQHQLKQMNTRPNSSVFYFSYPYLRNRTSKVRFRIICFAVRAQCRLKLNMTKKKRETQAPLEAEASDPDNSAALLTTDL